MSFQEVFILRNEQCKKQSEYWFCLFPQSLWGLWMDLSALADWRWGLISRGSQCVKMTLTSRMQRWSVRRLAVVLLQSSRGRSMEKGRVQSGLQSSSVKAMNHISWIVTPLAQLESPAHLAMLLDSPAQVKISLSCQHCLLRSSGSTHWSVGNVKLYL